MLQLVVARYSENLNWLENVRGDIATVVYDKSAKPMPDAVRLPNVGREAHTYLHHICERYGDLADIAVFCQGKPFDHAFDFHQTLRNLANVPESAPAFRWIGHTVDTDSSDGALFRAWSKNPDGEGLDLIAFHRALWGENAPNEYSFYLGAQFLVRRELILQQPRSFYEQARQISVEFPNAAHCFERCWDRVFNVRDATSDVLSGRKTAYLKRIKKSSVSNTSPRPHGTWRGGRARGRSRPDG
jgi:Protein of unknown function (DUF3431)